MKHKYLDLNPIPGKTHFVYANISKSSKEKNLKPRHFNLYLIVPSKKIVEVELLCVLSVFKYFHLFHKEVVKFTYSFLIIFVFPVTTGKISNFKINWIYVGAMYILLNVF